MKKNVLYLLLLLTAALFAPPVSSQAQSWTASAPSAGTFYLYNVGKEAFIYGANDWDKRASTTQHGGIPVTLVSSSGKYLISTAPLYSGKYFGFNSGKTFVYLDKADVLWEFIAVDGLTNTYIMKATSGSSTRYMVADASGTTTSAASSQPTDNLGYWQLLTKDQLIDYMSENAAPDNGIDATWAIQNFYFGNEANMDFWQGVSSTVGQEEQPYNRCIERWNKTTFDVYQEISGMPNGVYKLELQGFYRMGNSDNNAAASAAAREAGNEQLNATYYINNYEAPLKSILDYGHSSSYDTNYNTSSAVTVNGVNYYVPNSGKRAAYCFLHDEYWNEPLRAVVTDGTLRIGVKKSVGDANDWAAFDNFRLTYYGIDMSELVEAAKIRWHNKYDAIINQAASHTRFDDLMLRADSYCTSEEKLAQYEGVIWNSVSDILKSGNTITGLPFDITSLIQNPTFDSGTDGWTVSGTTRHSDYGLDDFYNNTNASLTQTLASMPAGAYTLKAQAFYRPAAEGNVAVAKYVLGTDPVKGSLVLGDQSQLLINLYDQSRYQPGYITDNYGGSYQKMVPNSKHASHEAFNLGQYWNIMNTTTTVDGDLTVGLKIENGNENNWLVFDNFRLYYSPTSTTIDVDLTDGMPTEDTEASAVTTGITLNAGEYNRVCLPFDLDETQTAATFTNVYTLGGVNESVGQLVPVSKMEAGKAYFVTVDVSKTLSVNDVRIKVAQPDSIPVMWEGAATVGNFNTFSFNVNPSAGVTLSSYAPVDWQDMSFTVNQENWRARRFLNEFTYEPSTSSKIDYYNVGTPMPLDQPHSVFIPVPQNSSDLTVTVSQNSDYSEAETFTFDAGTTLCEVPNLIPQNTYYYKVEAGGSVQTKGQFQTEGRLRMIKAVTAFNIRDLGGWETAEGNRLRYGKIFRGGELNFGHPVREADLAELRRLGCRAELDWRRNDECNNTEPTTSALTNDSEHYLYFNHDYANMSFGYDVNQDHYRRAFAFTLDNLRDDRAVYFHCRIGADRTGMYAMLIEGLCGMTYDQLAKDYELTSYSEAGTRKKSSGDFTSNFNYINALPGNTLQQKFFYYWHNEVGIDTQDLLDFVEIMVGDKGSLENADLAFLIENDRYLQNLDGVSAICSNGTTVRSGSKAVLTLNGTAVEEVDMLIDAMFITFAPLTTALEPDSPYELTIPAGALEKDGVENGGDLTLSFYTPVVFDGDYYIYSEEHDQFLGRNRNFGTRGVLDNFGIPATFTTDVNNITLIKFMDNNGYYGSQDGYTDVGSDGAIRWTLEPNGANDGSFLFYLNDGVNKYVTMSYDDTYDLWFNRLRTTSEAIPTPFMVKTLAEYNVIKARKKEINILAAATAAGISASDLSELETALGNYTATPLTGVIRSADAGNTSDWVLSEPWARNESGNGYNVGDYGAELYLKNATVSQTVTVPRAGLYKLTLNALIRQGSASRCCNAGYKGFILSNAFVSINDTYYAQVPDWFTDRRADDSPGSTNRFKSMTDEDPSKYSMEVYAYIDDSKTAKITLTVPGFVPEQWCIFNHWALTEYVPNVIISETSVTAPEACDYANVTFQRSIVANTNVESGHAWNTICFPFELSSDQIKAAFGENTVVKKLSDVSITDGKASLTFEEVSDIEANTPYIMQTDQAGTEYTFNGIAVTPSSDLTVEKNGGVQFVGTDRKIVVPENDFYIVNDVFKKSKGTTNMKGFRAYFHIPASAGIKSLGFDGGNATGIEGIVADELEGTVYDLSGRLVARPSKGMYIVNGKKVFIK